MCAQRDGKKMWKRPKPQGMCKELVMCFGEGEPTKKKKNRISFVKSVHFLTVL